MAKKKAAPQVEEAPAPALAHTVLEPDVADVDPGDGKGEHLAPLNAETWVVLDGSHKRVPDELDGKIAAVIAWPTLTQVDEATGNTHEYLPDNATLTVKERSQGQLLSNLPLSAFKSIHTNGRPGVLGFA